MADTEDFDTKSKMFASVLASTTAQIYLNGFVIGQSLSDVTIVAQTNGTPSVVLNMSFTTAKSLVIELDKVIKKLEEITGHTMLTMEDIGTKMGVKASNDGA